MSGRNLQANESTARPQVGRYRLEKRIGRGGFSDVYVGFDPETEQRVAVKVLRTDIEARFADQVRARFLVEQKIASAIGHPAVVQILQTSPSDAPDAYIVMQYVTGLPFCRYVRERCAGAERVEWLREVAWIGHQVADAMAAAHEKGIVHRDLKPDNVLVSDAPDALGYQVKILDFGIAKAPAALVSGGSDRAFTRYWTELGTVMGSPPYMAPEQNGAAHAVSGKADVFALGVMLLVCLLDVEEGPLERGEQALELPADLERVLACRPELPEAWNLLLGQMLALEPESRPSMREIAIRLQRLAQANATFGSSVELWLKAGKLPSSRVLSTLLTWADTAPRLTHDEKRFLRLAPAQRLRRSRRLMWVQGGLMASALALSGFGLVLGQGFSLAALTGAQAVGAKTGLESDEPGSLKLVDESETPSPKEVTQSKRESTAAAGCGQELRRCAERLAVQRRSAEQRQATIHALKTKLTNAESRFERAALEAQQLQAERDTHEAAASRCRAHSDGLERKLSASERALSAKVQEFGEASRRLQLCTRSLQESLTIGMPNEPEVETLMN